MRWRSAASSGLVSLTLLAAAAPAEGATAEMGAVAKVAAGNDPLYVPPIGSQFAVQSGDGALPAGNYSYAVPAGYGVITQWSHSAGNVSGALTLTVWRTPGDFVAVANESRPVVANTVHRFDTRIPVRPGDRLGLGSESGDVRVAFSGFNPNSTLALLTDKAIGDPQGPGTTKNGYLLSVAARVETDADGDGFGDDTQDGCPTRADVQGACPATPGGGTGGGRDLIKPRLGALRLSSTAFRAASSGRAFAAGGRTAPVGTVVSFTASEASSVRFRVERRATGRRVGRKCKAPTRRTRAKKRCTRYAAVKGAFTIDARVGTNTFTFRGRMGGKKLVPGRYRLRGRAADLAKNVSAVPPKRFRIVK